MSEQTRRYRDGPGYDHPWFDWPPPEAPAVWPNGARLAVMPLIHVEHFELDPDPDSFGDPRFAGALGSYRPDYNNFTRRLYGLRVGVWRLFDILKAHGLRATVALGAAAAEACPQIVERALRDGHGIAAHGTVANRMISERMSEAEERAFIAESAARLEACLGRRPRGWVGQDHGESSRTPGLLAEAGFDHVIDWPNDERPVPMRTEPPMVSIPAHTEWDDAELFAVRKVDAWRYPELIADAAECLHGEGGRMMTLGIHAWIFGQPHRSRHLDAALGRLLERDGLWNATSDEIADLALGKARIV